MTISEVLNIGVVGCAGRIRRMLRREVHETPGSVVAVSVQGGP